MNEFVQSIADAMNGAMGAPLTVMLLSMIPIAEARFAIPFGMSMGLDPGAAFGYAFLGSSLITPILLLVLIPIINALSKTRVFSKLGKFLYDKFEKRSQSLKETVTDDNAEATPEPEAKPRRMLFTKSDLKKMGGTAAFVAIPLPLTGVWTGSAVASIVKIGFVKGLIGVIVGNAAACGIITLISFLFQPYVNYITIAFFVIAVTVLVVLIIKLIVYKPAAAPDADGTVLKDASDAKNPTADDDNGKKE